VGVSKKDQQEKKTFVSATRAVKRAVIFSTLMILTVPIMLVMQQWVVCKTE
jgi:hypothetical protein